MKYFCAFLAAFIALSIPLHGKITAEEVEEVSRRLDTVEMIFWRGVFSSPGGAARKSLEGNLESLQKMCRKLQNKRDAFATQKNGNPAAGSAQLKNISARIRTTPVKTYMSGLKKTSVAEYRKSIRKNRRRNAPEEPLSPAGYKDFLGEISAKNLDVIHRKFNNHSDLSRTQEVLINKIAEDYYAALSALRFTIFMIHSTEIKSPDQPIGGR